MEVVRGFDCESDSKEKVEGAVCSGKVVWRQDVLYGCER